MMSLMEVGDLAFIDLARDTASKLTTFLALGKCDQIVGSGDHTYQYHVRIRLRMLRLNVGKGRYVSTRQM